MDRAQDSLRSLRELIEIDSPTGFTHRACRYAVDLFSGYGFQPQTTRKGAVRCELGPHPKLALAAHLDTLGGVVSKTRSDGHLSISPVGGLSFPMAEGEYVRIHTLDERVYTGTFLANNPSVHVNKEHASAKREAETMYVRLDEEVACEADTQALGIQNGDFVCFDPRYQELPSGYIKSRFLDNKAGCYVLFEVARRLSESRRQVPVELLLSNYEEVGHGGSCGYSPTIEELLVIDMGVHGEGCAGKETHCSICAKDSSGPYDYELRRRLVELARERQIPHVLDVYPFYSSDGSMALRAGHDFRVGLIGPGVAASHGVERTHRRGIEATIELCLALIDSHSPQ